MDNLELMQSRIKGTQRPDLSSTTSDMMMHNRLAAGYQRKGQLEELKVSCLNNLMSGEQVTQGM